MKFRLILLSLLLTTSLVAQDKTAVIELGKNCEQLDMIDLGENGFLLKTGKTSAPYSKKLKWEMHYINNNLELVYSLPVEKEQIDKQLNNPILSSPSGNYLYHGEQKLITTFGKGKMRYTQIKKNKEVKIFNINYKNYAYIEDNFCDDFYFYKLASKNGETGNSKKMHKETMILYKHNHEDFNREEFILDLPPLAKDKNLSSTFWEYSGQDDNLFYLHRKDINFKTNKAIYHIISLNKSEGKVVSQFSINFSIKTKHIRPSNNLNKFPGDGYSINNDDFDTGTISAGTSSRITFHHETGAYGNLTLDPDNKMAYIYGLYGDKPSSTGVNIKGYFLKGYDFTGTQQFETIKSLPKKLADEAAFRLHNVAFERVVTFTWIDNQRELIISSKKQSHKILFSEAGEFIKSINTKPIRRVRGTDPYLAIKEYNNNEKVTGFLEANVDIKRSKGDEYSDFKKTEKSTILRKSESDKLTFYLFKTE